jgi:hypothetical protein
MTMQSYPQEIQEFHNQLLRLPGIYDIISGINNLQGFRPEHLALSSFSRLPQGSLRRATGGLQREALIQFEFRIEKTLQAWKSLEFLAWFVREQARAGEQIQMRPGGLTPIVNGKIQLGETLYFQIYLFLPNAPLELAPVLTKVRTLTQALEKSLNQYQAAWKVN